MEVGVLDRDIITIWRTQPEGIDTAVSAAINSSHIIHCDPGSQDPDTTAGGVTHLKIGNCSIRSIKVKTLCPGVLPVHNDRIPDIGRYNQPIGC